jgi:hypothetical protein
LEKRLRVLALNDGKWDLAAIEGTLGLQEASGPKNQELCNAIDSLNRRYALNVYFSAMWAGSPMPRYADQKPAPAVLGTRHELKAEDGE